MNANKEQLSQKAQEIMNEFSQNDLDAFAELYIFFRSGEFDSEVVEDYLGGPLNVS